MPFLDGKPVIITKRNTDKYNNPISVKQIETKQVMDILNCIPVNYSIDRNYPIHIAGLHQIYSQDEITETTFFADYDQGILYFHPKLVGKSLNISYMGTGYILISSNRIYRYNKSDSTSGTIEASFEKIETLMKEILSGKVTADNIAAEVIGARTDKGGTTYNSIGDRLNAMNDEISSLEADILRYRNKIDIPGNTNTVNIGITEYDSSTDLLFVYLSGVRMLEGVDYNIDAGGLTISCIHPMQWVKGDQIYFEVLKKGRNAISTNPVGQFLPLTGGVVTGDVFVNGGLSTLTPQTTDNSDKVATTAFVKTAIANNESVKEVVTARTDKDGHGYQNLKERLDDSDSRLDNKANKTSFIKVSAGTGQVAANGQVTKVQLQNIIDRTPGILMSNYGIIVPSNCNKALVEFCSGWGTGIKGDIEHRLYIAQTTADTVGVNQLQYRDCRTTTTSPSLESVIHSSFTVDGLKEGNVLYMNVVQVTGGNTVIGDLSYMRVTFYF